MIKDIKKHIEKIETLLIETTNDLEKFRIKYNSKKGIIASFFSEFKKVPNDQKKEIGQLINTLKNKVQEKLDYFSTLVKDSKDNTNNEYVDLTLSAYPFDLGGRHPINIVKKEIIEIFSRIGFNLSEGPEIEDDWHNFTALNLPINHPARDMQDTFFIEKNPDWVLRTHTSSIQIRHMENNKPPIRILSPGRVFRNEDISSRSHCFFHQIEGLYIDKDVSFAQLKKTLSYFTNQLFGKSEIRLRPSYFPFTEPSAEVDIYWGLKTEDDYRITKGTGWLEILGCGMVDPAVLKNCDIDPETYSGFAFGMGLERIAMLLYGITDIRDFSINDIKLLRQFKSVS